MVGVAAEVKDRVVGCSSARAEDEDVAGDEDGAGAEDGAEVGAGVAVEAEADRTTS